VVTTLKNSDVIDRYLQVVPGAGSLADAYMDAVKSSIVRQELAVRFSHETASAGFLGAIRGNKRPVLMVQPEDSALIGFTVYLFGVPNGINLAAGWYLTESGRGQKNVAQKFGAIPFGGLVSAYAAMHDALRDLSMFDVADLQAIISAIHQFAVMEAVYSVATKVGFDHKRIGRQSAGFFGIG
jgi:hypothetical protein